MLFENGLNEVGVGERPFWRYHAGLTSCASAARMRDKPVATRHDAASQTTGPIVKRAQAGPLGGKRWRTEEHGALTPHGIDRGFYKQALDRSRLSRGVQILWSYEV